MIPLLNTDDRFVLSGPLHGWCGPIVWRAQPGDRWRRGVWGPIGPSSEPERYGILSASDGHDRSYEVRLDPMCREARERIVYMRNLRAWFREDAMLLPWQCAALTAGAALNGARELPPPCGLVGPWQAFGSAGLLPHTCRYDRPYIVGTGPAVSYIGGRGKVYGAPHRDAATADAAALADNVALSIDVNEIVLPVGKEGARWRRE